MASFICSGDGMGLLPVRSLWIAIKNSFILFDFMLLKNDCLTSRTLRQAPLDLTGFAARMAKLNLSGLVLVRQAPLDLTGFAAHMAKLNLSGLVLVRQA
jgi:hypothetical protein